MAKHNLGPLYQKLSNQDVDTLLGNMDLTPNVEWESHKIGSETISFPMWKATIASQSATYDDYMKFKKTGKFFKADEINDKSGELKTEWSKASPVEAHKKLQQILSDRRFVGAVDPKADMGKQEVPKPAKASPSTGAKVGAVDPSADMGKQSIPSFPKAGFKTNHDEVIDTKVVTKEPAGSATKTHDNVGVVSPQADMGKQTTPKPDTTKATKDQITVYDATKDNKTEVNRNANWFMKPINSVKVTTPSMVGAVDPKEDLADLELPHFFGSGKGWTTKKAKLDFSEYSEPVVERAGGKATPTKIVNPSKDLAPKNLGPINFDEFKTDHIN